MSKWVDELGKWQRIVIATFFGLLGCALWLVPFWFETKEMAKGQEASWPTVYYFFLLFGTVAIALSLKLSRIEKLFNISTGFLSNLSSKKKGGGNAS
nr:hypothetical protein [uncultured Allomuricauda sp.]